MISIHNVTVNSAMATPQFWLLWIVLCLNVTAGIGILESAAPMVQNLFPGKVTAIAAGGFVGVLSLFNMAGRFFWASLSDFIGRKATYMAFFAIGMVLDLLLPSIHSLAIFVLVAGVLLSMYGGGFATIPAYLKDLFGGINVSAIHGRVLTAWTTAGIIGPLVVNATSTSTRPPIAPSRRLTPPSCTSCPRFWLWASSPTCLSGPSMNGTGWRRAKCPPPTPPEARA